jgi:hypothetical protein
LKRDQLIKRRSPRIYDQQGQNHVIMGRLVGKE